MKRMILLLTVVLASQVSAAPLHLDLEMTSEEYQKLLQKMESHNHKALKADEPAIANALKIGARLSKWIALVNQNRTPETAIRLTSAATRRGIPIDKPNMYSPSIIESDTRKILSDLPKTMKDVLLATTELPTSIGIDDETFIVNARKVDRNYQSAARYKGVDQYRAEYIKAANKDVRGYYYLMTNKIGEAELSNVATIPSSQVDTIKKSLTQMCLNGTGNLNRCKKEVTKAFNKNTLDAVYKRYIKAAKRTWDDFFKIPPYGRRHDFKWSETVATVPFNTPEIPKFLPYLQVNIEDEFRWNSWRLKMNFGNYPNGPLLKFEPGVVPHVNELGGNEIVMDSNQPIEEYESQWTIRHEFGHIIGLPDCYHEFYDVQTSAYVNYQLDTTDLMCSRAGNMNERIYLELKSAYSRY